SASIVSLLGSWDGKFAPGARFTSGLSPYRAVVGDVTGDGKPDVVTSGPGGLNGRGLLSLFAGDGSGGFAAPRSYWPALQPVQTISADFTGDGKPDLLTLGGTCQITNCANNGVAQLRAGSGTGAFGAAAEFTVGNNPTAMAVGDFNNDGKPDVA